MNSFPNETKSQQGNISASNIGQVQTSQQFIDSVAQLDNSVNTSQRQLAYQSLLQATKQIQESSTDAGIRSAAENFEKQLTRAYQNGKQISLSQTATRNASEQLSYVSNQDMKTLLDNSPFAMQKAIEVFGSAENAQNALFHSPAARSAFANTLHKELNNSGWNDENPMPISTIDLDTMARPHRQSFENEVTQQFDHSLSADTLDSQSAKSNALGKLDVHETPNTDRVTQAVENQRQDIKENLEQMTQKLLTEKGVTLSAKILYEEKESGLSTVLGNAFLGGATYDSPIQYKEKLSERAENSSDFKFSMQELDQETEVRMSDLEKAAQRKN